MESGISQIIVCQCIHFVISLFRQLQVFSEITGSLRHAVQAVVRFSAPVEGIGLGLAVVLANGNRLVKVADCLLKRGIGKCLCTELEQYFLFRFHDAGTRMGNAFNGFQCRFVAAGVQIYFNEIVAYHFGILGVGEFVQEFLENGNRLSECRVGRFVNAQGIVIGSLFFYFHIGIGGGSLFKSHTGFVLFGQLQVGKSHMQVRILRQCVVGACYFSQRLSCF